jgi:putative transposase
MKTYSTNLTDSQWNIVDDLSKDNCPRKYEIRDIFDGIFYLLKTGCQWRMLPLCFPPWKTVYYYFTVWKHK